MAPFALNGMSYDTVRGAIIDLKQGTTFSKAAPEANPSGAWFFCILIVVGQLLV
jgi:hypothetical protein